mmetsp:Transcript_25480/g.71262  ORF Transcript_25480/g.71262 Transcript_25480/m.71262 type:complete len:747 (+) Transcript_25480:361-2601(+)|eukprot:CAMPEP_0117667786 /NCGR_PEP_ID=MMETSP0804-20121206/11168_1 /TAXON_ID=1074897 /ORGANISM="Tetraselmis astigmatica, Strain CCMP880" /LENGTH=746 /DNA_ID=CAMNT_0005475567 /DNA_START=297 /DNA_END=2537 /DNA_ORIENTATION=-
MQTLSSCSLRIQLPSASTSAPLPASSPSSPPPSQLPSCSPHPCSHAGRQDVARVAAAIPLDPLLRVVPSSGILASSTFEYVQGPFALCLVYLVRRSYRLSYSGEVDQSGRPHGYGLWTDNNWHGETLEGWWRHGYPVGPFRSRETGSGSGFVALRIAYAHGRSEGLTEMAMWPRNGPLKYGVASAECSVSGFFFRDYPIVRFLQGPKTSGEIAQAVGDDSDRRDRASLGGAMKWLYGALQPLDAQDPVSAVSVVITASKHGLHAGGYHQAGSDRRSTLSKVITVRAVMEEAEDGLARYESLSHGIQDIEQGQTGSTEQQINGSLPSALPSQELQQQKGGQLRPSVKALFSANAENSLGTGLALDGWTACQHNCNPEVIVYIHGFNSPVDWGIRALSQLLALGNFPSYLKPFVYSWPTGRTNSYFAAKQSAESEETAQGLVDVITGLDAAGFKRVHILTHSMGVRVLLAAIPKLRQMMAHSVPAWEDSSPDEAPAAAMGPSSPFAKLAARRGDERRGRGGSPPLVHGGGPSAGGTGEERERRRMENGLTISTVTMINPETGLSSFLRDSLPPMRSLCPLITIYGDAKDTAIMVAEMANACGSLFGWNITPAHASLPASSSSSGTRGSSSDYVPLTNGDVEQPGNARAEDDPECCCGAAVWERSLGNYIYSIKDAYGKPEDIDVVDTTFLNANVHVTRHMFFSLNREFVEDLRDLVTTLRRAGQRPRLEPRGGNVYSFLVAPPFVKAD